MDYISAIVGHYSFFSKHFPRHPGSTEEKVTIAYILQVLDEADIQYTVTDFSSFEDGHSFSKNIDTGPLGPGEDTLLIVVPINHEIDAVRDGEAWNLALGLGLLIFLQEVFSDSVETSVNVRFLFAGGEFPFDSERQFGSELFLSDFYPEHNIGVLYLQLASVPGVLEIRNGQDLLFSPFWIIDEYRKSLEQTGVPFIMELEETQLFRLGISDRDSMIAPYLAGDFPALEVVSGTGADPVGGEKELSRTEWLTRFLAAHEYFFRELNRNGLTSDWDSHYLYMRFGPIKIFLTERTYIYILLGVFSVIIAFVLFYRRRMGKYRKVLLRNFWTLFVLIILIFLFLLMGTFVIRGISFLRGTPEIWLQAPVMFFLLKITTVFALFAIFYRYLKQFPFPKVRSFYSASAIGLLLILIVLAAVFDITLVIFFIWPFFWAVAFSLFQNKYSKLYCMVLSPCSLVYGLYLIFSHDAGEAVFFIINSPLWGNVFIALIILPFTLMVIRTAIAFHDTARSTMDLQGWVLFSIPVGALLAFILYAFLFQPFGPERPQHIHIHETIDYGLAEREMAVTSNAPLPDIRFSGEVYRDVRAGTAGIHTQISEDAMDLIEVQVEKKVFLDRKYYSLMIYAEGEPLKIRLLLSTAGQMVVYDSNFPFRVSAQDNKGEIYIGAYPPRPLAVEIVLPEDLVLDVQCVAEYTAPPYDFEIHTDAEISQRTTFIKWIEL